ncbi:hypothetical protein [Kitasatospora sp. KL5]|uniref:hypothetical protein n=1 Tax=Kitasatospora sp. KL5 TaxID=3425125 RepID=UPI003D6EB69B
MRPAVPHRYADELARLAARPAVTAAPPGLTALAVRPIGDLEAYARRLREILSAAVRAAGEQDFDADPLDESGIPPWFAAVTDPTGTAGTVHTDVPPEAVAGAARYGPARGEDPWDLQEWLYCFDPELRRWRWWDATTPDGRTAVLWLDTRGEPVVPCEELRWAAHAAGAHGVTGPTPAPTPDWPDQPSIGLPA